jgi:hypothetical protein
VCKYIVAGGAALWAISMILLYVCEQGAKIFTDLWLGFWTGGEFGDGRLTFYLSCYAGLAVLFSIVTYVRSLVFTFGTVRFLPLPTVVL